MSEWKKAKEAERLARMTGLSPTSATVREAVGDTSTLEERLAASRAKKEKKNEQTELSPQQAKELVYSVLAANEISGADIGKFVHEALKEESVMIALLTLLHDKSHAQTREQRTKEWLKQFFPNLR